MIFLLSAAIASQCAVVSTHGHEIRHVSCEGDTYIAWGEGGSVRYHRSPPDFGGRHWSIVDTLDTTALTGGPSVGVVVSSFEGGSAGLHQLHELLIMEPDGVWMRERNRTTLAVLWLSKHPVLGTDPSAARRLVPSIDGRQLVLTPVQQEPALLGVYDRSCADCDPLHDVSALAGRWVLQGDALARPAE